MTNTTNFYGNSIFSSFKEQFRTFLKTIWGYILFEQPELLNILKEALYYL